MANKVCTKCGRELPLSEFHRMKNGKYGLQNYCKECKRLENKKWKAENYEKCVEYQHRYYQKRKEKMKTLAAREKFAREREFKRDVLGGYVVHILNYPFNKERKYNVVSTAGDVFKTNDKQEFLKYLEAI